MDVVTERVTHVLYDLVQIGKSPASITARCSAARERILQHLRDLEASSGRGGANLRALHAELTDALATTYEYSSDLKAVFRQALKELEPHLPPSRSGGGNEA